EVKRGAKRGGQGGAQKVARKAPRRPPAGRRPPVRSKRATGPLGLRTKRVYAPPADGDGLRVLVDRLWPRGIAKARAKIDLWLKDVAPSTELRRRMHAARAVGPLAWRRFVAAYAHELEQEPARGAAHSLLSRLGAEPVTLLYAAKLETRNNAVALKAWLAAKARARRRRARPPGRRGSDHRRRGSK